MQLWTNMSPRDPAEAHRAATPLELCLRRGARRVAEVIRANLAG